MTNAFRTEEGAEAWTPSVIKELTKIGPKNAFAMVQIDYSQIPSGAPIIMLQVEHSMKKETDEMKTRLVVNGAQEPYKEDEDNYAPTALPKGGQLLLALASQEGRRMRGIDITCAFASESLTAEDGDMHLCQLPRCSREVFSKSNKRFWLQRQVLRRHQQKHASMEVLAT